MLDGLVMAFVVKPQGLESLFGRWAILFIGLYSISSARCCSHRQIAEICRLMIQAQPGSPQAEAAGDIRVEQIC